MTEPTQWRTAGDARVKADAVPTVVQQRNVPEAIRSLSTLESPDYVDLFIATANGATDKTPEQWARATVEGVHPWARFVAWRVLCGLRLEPRPSPDYLAGWRIADRGDSWIRMEASSWFMTAQIVSTSMKGTCPSPRSSATTSRWRHSCGRRSPSSIAERCPTCCVTR